MRKQKGSQVVGRETLGFWTTAANQNKLRRPKAVWHSLPASSSCRRALKLSVFRREQCNMECLGQTSTLEYRVGGPLERKDPPFFAIDCKGESTEQQPSLRLRNSEEHPGTPHMSEKLCTGQAQRCRLRGFSIEKSQHMVSLLPVSLLESAGSFKEFLLSFGSSWNSFGHASVP